MASITIRNLDDNVKSRLRVRAAHHGRSMEEEARQILKDALAEKSPERLNLAQMIRRYIDPVGGVDLEIPPRQPVRPPPDLTR